MIAVCVLTFSSMSMWGQDKVRAEGNAWQQRVRAEKEAFLNAELNLTPEEAQAFWPLYNKMEDEKRTLMQKSHKAYWALRAALKEGDAKDSEISKLTASYLDLSQSCMSVDKKYLKLFNRILPADKVAKLYVSEERFRRKQMQKLNSHGDRQSGKK